MNLYKVLVTRFGHLHLMVSDVHFVKLMKYLNKNFKLKNVDLNFNNCLRRPLPKSTHLQRKFYTLKMSINQVK